MGKLSHIQWTHHTFNPWWGCTKVSPGCKNCYAEGLSRRWGHDTWGPKASRRFFGEKHWSEPLKWDRAARQAGEVHRVFTASMADVFEARQDLLEPRARLFNLIEDTPNLQWLILTKRPELMLELAPEDWQLGWPENTVAMTSIEDQRRADERIPLLLRVPAPLRALSIEPLLESVTLLEWISEPAGPSWAGRNPSTGIDWVIVGGESGPRARPMKLDWALHLKDECLEHQVAFFFKQTGSVLARELGLKDRAGGDQDELPIELLVRQIPRQLRRAA